MCKLVYTCSHKGVHSCLHDYTHVYTYLLIVLHQFLHRFKHICLFMFTQWFNSYLYMFTHMVSLIFTHVYKHVYTHFKTCLHINLQCLHKLKLTTLCVIVRMYYIFGLASNKCLLFSCRIHWWRFKTFKFNKYIAFFVMPQQVC